MAKISNSRLLNEEGRKEFGILLLLDQIMRYDLLYQEKKGLQKIVEKLEAIVSELNKGFFPSEEQEQELNFKKKN